MTDKQLLLNTFQTLLREMSPEKLLDKQCSYTKGILKIKNSFFNLNGFKHIHLLGSGKAVLPMAKSIHNLLGSKIKDTLLVGAYEKNITLKDTTYIQSSHPIPSKISISSAKFIQNRLDSLLKDDFFIYLLGGGTSSLLEIPETNITLKELQKTTEVMLKNAMPIEKINCVRKHISAIKGGKLIKNLKANGVVLVLSDVIGDDLQSIGSAPLYYDDTTFSDAINSLKEYKIFDKIPKSVQLFLKEGVQNRDKESPKNKNPLLKHIIIGSNSMVLEKAKEILTPHIKTELMQKRLSKEVKYEAKKLYNFAKENNKKRCCFLFGGECTVDVKRDGIGGRNQHLALTFLKYCNNSKLKVVFLSAATDGVDGNSNAAGAIIETDEKTNIDSAIIDRYLNDFNSNIYFSKNGGLIKITPTHNNLLDIVMMIL